MKNSRAVVKIRMSMIVALMLAPLTASAEEEIRVSPATKSATDVLVHEVRSPYQAGVTKIRVVSPRRKTDSPLVVYLLPVEAKDERRWGDPIREVLDRRLHEKHAAYFVSPTFSHLPWYTDHPTDPTIRQESYLLKVVIPFIERTYPVKQGAAGRHLLGFSKSGWGAFSLLLRHPRKFGRAVAWDAPLTMPTRERFGAEPIFATRKNFLAHHIPTLLSKRAADFKGEPRLAILSYDAFRGHHLKLHEQMEQLKISHLHRDGPYRKHHWNSGWVEEAVRFLVERPTDDNR